MRKLSAKKAASGSGSGFHVKIGVEIRSVGGGSHHIDAAGFAVKHDLAIDQREKRVITAATDAEARMHFGAALADDDVAGDDGLAAEFLHAEALAA